MKDKELAILINDWFQKDISNKWRDTLVGAAIRKNLQYSGNWKNAPRGNPSKGGKEKKRIEYEKQYGKLPDREERD